MNYRKFMDALADEIRILSGEGVEVKIHRIKRNNGIFRNGITIENNPKNLTPLIFLEHYYDKYRQGIGIGELARQVLRENEEYASKRGTVTDEFSDFSKMKNRILYRLINFDRNYLLLKEIPHFRLLDLAMVFYYRISFQPDEDGTALIRKCDLERWEITPEELCDIARENTPLSEPSAITPIRTVIEQLGTGQRKEEEGEEEVPMYVLTNKTRTFGAACLSYHGVFRELSDRFESDLFILPSSIHEVILLPDSGAFSKTDLEKMVMEINESEVAPYEVLSSHVYKYCRSTENLSL